jgi:hypothetical protein
MTELPDDNHEFFEIARKPGRTRDQDRYVVTLVTLNLDEQRKEIAAPFTLEGAARAIRNYNRDNERNLLCTINLNE